MTDTKRIAYLDMARGIGMLLVVMGHVEYINLGLRQFITVFHMPLFFLISGILIWERQEEKTDYRVLIKKKLCSIMIPYAVFSMLSFIMETTRIVIKGLNEWDIVLRQLFQSLCLQGVSTLWFLPALCMSEFVFVGLRKKTSHRSTCIITGILIIGCSILNRFEKEFYQLHNESLGCNIFHEVSSMIIRNLFCVGFLCIGYYLGKVLFSRWKKSKWNLLYVCIFAGMAVLLIKVAGIADLRYMVYSSLVLYIPGAVAGGLMILTGCRLLSELRVWRISDILKYFGKNSLIIMVTHMDFRVLYISILISSRFQMMLPFKAGFSICVVILVFIIEIPIIWFINRYVPFVLGKRRKS